MKNKWAAVIAEARIYKYAEQEDVPGAPSGSPFSGNFIKWPNSLYAVLGINSNTFVRHIVAAAGLPMKELPPPHPGNNKASSNHDPSDVLYFRNRWPWKK